MTRGVARVLFVAAVLPAACIDLDRLLPTELDLGSADQSAVSDGMPSADLASVEGGDAGGATGTCDAHLHEGVWTKIQGPSGQAGLQPSSLWASPDDPTLVMGYAGVMSRTSDGTLWGTPSLGSGSVAIVSLAGTSDNRLCYVNPSEPSNSHLYCVDLTGYPGASPDLSVAGGFVDQTPTLVGGSLALIAVQPGTGRLLLGGYGISNAGDSVLVDSSSAVVSTSPGPVRAIAASDIGFWRGGYRFLDTSTDGVAWTPVYNQSGNDELTLALAALLGGSTSTISVGFGALWAGHLPSGEPLLVAAISPRDSFAPQTMCWRRGAGPSWRCQVIDFVTAALWGTGCGVVLAVGPQYQALRYDAAGDAFVLEVHTPAPLTATDAFTTLTGHADGTAFAGGADGSLFRRD